MLGDRDMVCTKMPNGLTKCELHKRPPLMAPKKRQTWLFVVGLFGSWYLLVCRRSHGSASVPPTDYMENEEEE